MKPLDADDDEGNFEPARSIMPPEDVVTFNELRSCTDIFNMYTRGILDIQPDFQREGGIWSNKKQTRFIDSLAKQLPIPSMCFSIDAKTRKWQIIDGLQRVSSIIKFLAANEEKDWRLEKNSLNEDGSHSDEFHPNIAGKAVSELKDPNSPYHNLYRIVEDTTLPITVVRCNYDRQDHNEYLFNIFYRLNSGGTKLNNQEIRNCIYSGNFNDLLKELDAQNSDWRAINRMKDEKQYRFTKRELILRFFAFSENVGNYEGNLTTFLNSYMYQKRNLQPDELQQKCNLFQRVTKIIWEKLRLGSNKVLSKVILEAVMVGISANLSELEAIPEKELKDRYDALLKTPELSTMNLRERIGAEEKTKQRLTVAKEIFAGR